MQTGYFFSKFLLEIEERQIQMYKSTSTKYELSQLFLIKQTSVSAISQASFVWQVIKSKFLFNFFFWLAVRESFLRTRVRGVLIIGLTENEDDLKIYYVLKEWNLNKDYIINY